ncbi:FYVE, RhoGEF and PH domain-containing protein 6-like [Vanacampus margaritifer]
MMKSGMRKPPLAPKPNLAQLQPGARFASTAREDVVSQQSPGPPGKMKPKLAPKPNPSKLNSKPAATSPAKSPQVVGLLNTRNGIQHEDKKPNWDYIIPICLCSQKNCRCIRDSHLDKTQKDFKTLRKVGAEEDGKTTSSESKTEISHTSTANGHLPNRKPPRDTLPVEPYKNRDKNVNTSSPQIKVGQLVFRTVIDEANAVTLDDTERGPGGDAKPLPVPVPRRHKTSLLAQQEKVEDEEEEEEREEIPIQEGRNVKELKLSSEGKGGASSAVSWTAGEKATSVARPAPTPRRKPYLAAPENPPSPAPSTLQHKVDEGDLGWDSNAFDTELSVDKDDGKVAREGRRHQEAADKKQTDSSFLPNGPDNRDGAVEQVPKKPQRNDSPMARVKKTGSPALGEDLKSNPKTVTADLPLPPVKTTTTPGSSPTPTSGKPRRRSFSGTDLVRSEGRRSSFRKLLDLKLSVMMLPKRTAKGSQTSESDQQDGPQRLRGALGTEREFSSPLVGLEQSVDGEDRDGNYENICHYEEISDYENVYFGGSDGSSATWQSLYNDDGIYEEPEAYLSPDQNADYDRSSLEEEVYDIDGPSDHDFMLPFSDDDYDDDDDEDEDDSSFSSKGDAEQPEESAMQSGARKTKIHHIATEIMTSEKVFVDVLKLLHVDFRDAVAKASRQNGKAVIEDRLLNQILYYLPQLYELNQDLLQELHNRLAKWDESEQLSDIFLKKGPYLKMYSTYIREFDKNAALLEEQSKKNPLFGAVVREFEASPRCANLALKHYLLKPIQRIPQYQLLLRDYLKNLSKDSADYKDTQDALAIVREVANHANDIMKQGDNFQKLIQVQCSLNGHHEIVQPGRIFVKEGVLNKLSRKVMQPRMFFLFNDTLLYTTPVQSGQYKFNNMLSLAGMRVSRPSQEACQNEFLIESVERSFILSASSAPERDEWLEAISKAISDYTKKKITFISGKSFDEVQLSNGDGASLGSKAPIWIPDPRATMCMICTCEFTLTWRRHHCRACGKVVCQSCSSNKRSLEYLKNQLARVCDQCYLVLREHQICEEDLSAAAIPKSSFGFTRKHKRIPAALKEVSASTDNPSMSGYLQRFKGKKKGKRLWFVIKDKVLYTYAASEDVAALESQPLLGFVLKVDHSQKLQFKLYHKNTLYYNFKADDVQTAQRWINTFRESAVL